MAFAISTDYLAAWGALTGSLVLLWDILKWFRDGPRLKVRVRPNTFYEDGEIVDVEKTEHGEFTSYAVYYHIEITNVGTQPTTLLDIEATTKPLGIERIERIKRKSKRFLISCSEKAFTPHFGKSLPQVLKPGEVWSCRLNENSVISISQAGQPKIALSVAHLNNPVFVKVKLTKP